MRALSLRSRLLFVAIVPLIIVALASALLRASIDDGLDAERRVAEAEEVLVAAEVLTRSVIDVQTGQRGYAISGQEEFLEPYAAGREEFARTISPLRQALTGRPADLARLDDVERDFNALIAEVADPIIALRRSGQVEAALAAIADGGGKTRVDAIRSRMEELTLEQAERRAAALAVANEASGRARLLAVLGPTLAIAAGLVVAVFVSDRIARRILAVSAVAGRLASGDLTSRAVETDGDEVGRMAGAFNVMADRLEELVGEERTARSDAESLAVAFIGHIPAAAYIKDRDLRYTIVNDEFVRTSALPREALLGRTSIEVFGTGRPDRDALDADDRHVLRTGELTERELRIGSADDDESHNFVVKFAIPGADGTTAAIGCIAMDITDRKRAEQQVLEMNALLERRVAERTAELEAANVELEAFSYSVSHDLRAPLRSIDGFSQAVLDDYGPQLDATGRGYLERVRNGSRRMAGLIDDLLTLSRVSRLELRRQDLDLSTLAADVVSELRQREPGRNVDVEIEPGLRATADPGLTRVVLDNLIGNSWKFTGRTATARIRIGRDPEAPGGPAFVVEDNGAGFDMAYANKLFGPFQRLHRTQEFGGTGVGLATVQRIVRRHGGSVSGTGTPGVGARFTFRLEPDFGSGAAPRRAAQREPEPVAAGAGGRATDE